MLPSPTHYWQCSVVLNPFCFGLGPDRVWDRDWTYGVVLQLVQSGPLHSPNNKDRQRSSLGVWGSGPDQDRTSATLVRLQRMRRMSSLMEY